MEYFFSKPYLGTSVALSPAVKHTRMVIGSKLIKDNFLTRQPRLEFFLLSQPIVAVLDDQHWHSHDAHVDATVPIDAIAHTAVLSWVKYSNSNG